MQTDDIIVRRMRNQRLWESPTESPEGVLRSLGAMQAQEFVPAKWAVGQRSRGATNADLDRAYAEGAILRTHILRPTWHFVAAADLRWLMALSGPRVHALNAYVYRQTDLDENLIARTNALLAGAVRGGRHLTRAEIADRLDDAGIPASGLRLAYIVMRAELDAVICSGAPRGKQHTYALFDERVSPGPVFEHDQALAELIRRYFTSRGPATLKDFLRWSSLTVADGRRGLQIVADELEQETVDGRTYWFAPSSPGRASRGNSPTVDLIQTYDEYVMGYSESRDLIQHSSTTAALPRGWPTFPHAILLNGRLIGRWRPVVGARSVAIETQLAQPLSAAESQALAEAVERYGAFVETPVSLVS
jgi:hypothetical protein